jgi:uroporphyrinogen decarboxylase
VSKAVLTGRERVRRMFQRQEQDRIPRHDTFWKETIERWQSEGLDGDRQTVLDMLESDFYQLCWCWPRSFPGEDVIVEQDEQTKVIRDGHGKLVRYWKHRSGTPEHLGFDCSTREIWETRYKPALLQNMYQLDIDSIRKNHAAGRAANRWVHLTGIEAFEHTRTLMGDEISLMAMVEDPEWVIDVARTITDVVLSNFQQVVDSGIDADGVWIYGDMAYNHATMCSPAMYRELIWPQHKRMADWAHEHGMKFIYHTDGDINGVMDLYAEAGFDCVQPLEAKANVDIRELLPRYGDRLAFFGNINVMLMATNDRDRIEAEIRSKLEAGKSTRGYAYHSDHSVPPQVTWETYKFIMDCVKRYGAYA